MYLEFCHKKWGKRNKKIKNKTKKVMKSKKFKCLVTKRRFELAEYNNVGR